MAVRHCAIRDARPRRMKHLRAECSSYDFGLKPREFTASSYFDPQDEQLYFLPEGPRVLQNFPAEGRMLGWVAIQHGVSAKEGSINVLDLSAQRNTSFLLPGRPGFFAETTRPGVVLVGMERSLVFFDLLNRRQCGESVEVTRDVRVIINDGVAVDGGVLFGTKHLEFNQPLAALYFFDVATRQVHTLLDGQFCSNGKVLTMDQSGATLIPKTISRYKLDWPPTQVLEQSLVVEPNSLLAFPDGMRAAPACEHAAEGESVIVAFYNPDPVEDGVALQLRLRDGAVLCKWAIRGSPRVTCPEFVKIGREVKLLFTTAVENMPTQTRRLARGAGKLYIADTPFRSIPPTPPLLPF
jgi:sugar lactone lactonase YvrE